MAKGFKRLKRDGKMTQCKVLTNGSEIIRDGDEFFAYDASKRYLGWCQNQTEAEHMAEQGYPNHLEEICDLSLWQVWNDGVSCGAIVLQDEHCTQFMSLKDGIVMAAKKHDDGWDGWKVSLMTDNDFLEEYQDEHYSGVLALHIAEKPFVLE